MADAYESDTFLLVRGFRVEIDGVGGKDVDTAWESVAGGFTTTSPGHKSVGEITLRGAMTAGRKAMCQWIQETVQGKSWKRTVFVTPILLDGVVGETLVFEGCVVSSYAPPPLKLRAPDDPCPEPIAETLRFTYESFTVRP